MRMEWKNSGEMKNPMIRLRFFGELLNFGSTQMANVKFVKSWTKGHELDGVTIFNSIDASLNRCHFELL